MKNLFLILSETVRTVKGVIFPPTCFNCARFVSLSADSAVCAACRPLLAKNRPPFCPGCGRHTGSDAGCPDCRGGGARPVDRVYFVLPYRGAARKLVQMFKINRAAELTPLLSRLFLEFLSEEPGIAERYDAVVPIPPHRQSLFQTPWAPSGELARMVAPFVRAPVRNLIRREGRMKKQSSLSKRERASNVRGAYRVRARGLAYRSILLVDDVLTTGSTAAECARILKEKGAGRVDVLACAGAVLS